MKIKSLAHYAKGTLNILNILAAVLKFIRIGLNAISGLFTLC